MTTTACNHEACSFCKQVGPLDYWLPEKYAADNYSPSSFSGDELIPTCPPCSQTYRMSHDPNLPRKPYRWL
jgi:hypothetical protein